MAKYEIMLLVDPKEEGKESVAMATEIFKDFKGETLERTELAYEINKSKQAKYIVAEVEANGEQITEFRRKANILKTLWRYQVINLDKEVGREGAAEAMEKYAKKQAERAAERAAYRESRGNRNRDFRSNRNTDSRNIQKEGK